MWGLGSYGRLGLGEVMDVPLARRTEHHGSLGCERYAISANGHSLQGKMNEEDDKDQDSSLDFGVPYF